MHDDPARFRDLTLDGFIGRLASKEPVPGGGSASAVAASLAASLVAMVASLSEGRARYAMYSEVHARTKAAGTELADRLLRLADEDAASYGLFAAAMKLPKDSPEEQAVRSQAIKIAARGASEVPMRCVEACLEVVENAELLAARCNVNASSDLDVAALLAEAAARGAAANVLVNLPAVGDPEYATQARAAVEGLMSRVTSLAARTHEVVATGVLRDPVAG
ncbi:MAG: cyclodeaminase/cyclohydrolase family protein [Candidatus Limnocylindrales bacterium]